MDSFDKNRKYKDGKETLELYYICLKLLMENKGYSIERARYVLKAYPDC